VALDRYGRVPLLHYPPGYPVALAAADVVVPGDVADAARAVNALVLAALAVCAYALARLLGAPRLGAALVAVVATFTPSAFRLSLWAMSDVLAATAALGAVALAGWSLRAPLPARRAVSLARRAVRFEVAAGLAAAVAALARYSGGAAAVATAAVVVVAHRDEGIRLWRRIARVALPALAAVGATLLSGALRHADSARPVAWHPPGRYDIHALADVVGMWLVGDQGSTLRRWSALVVAVVATALVVHLWRSRRRATTATEVANAPAPVAAVLVGLGALVVAHVGVLLVTSALLDTDVTADRRLLLPVELAVVVAAAAVVARARLRILGWSALAGFVWLRLALPVPFFPEGLAWPARRDTPRPELYRLTADLPDDTIIATNEPEAVWRDTRRASIVAPAREDKLTGRPVPDFPERVAEMGRLVGARRGVLVFETPRVLGIDIDVPRVLNTDEVARYLPCAEPMVEAPEGTIYDLAPCAD
jgi:hypothetical protein